MNQLLAQMIDLDVHYIINGLVAIAAYFIVGKLNSIDKKFENIQGQIRVLSEKINDVDKDLVKVKTKLEIEE